MIIDDSIKKLYNVYFETFEFFGLHVTLIVKVEKYEGEQ